MNPTTQQLLEIAKTINDKLADLDQLLHYFNTSLNNCKNSSSDSSQVLQIKRSNRLIIKEGLSKFYGAIPMIAKRSIELRKEGYSKSTIRKVLSGEKVNTELLIFCGKILIELKEADNRRNDKIELTVKRIQAINPVSESPKIYVGKKYKPFINLFGIHVMHHDLSIDAALYKVRTTPSTSIEDDWHAHSLATVNADYYVKNPTHVIRNPIAVLILDYANPEYVNDCVRGRCYAALTSKQRKIYDSIDRSNEPEYKGASRKAKYQCNATCVGTESDIYNKIFKA